MERLLKILGYVLLWGLIIVATYLLYVGGRERRDTLEVSDVVVNIVDSTASGNLITRSMIEQILSRERIELVGTKVNSVPLTQIEEIVSRNGFVSNAVAYVDYSGVLNIDIRQRVGVVRILLDGYNCYITKVGFVFGAPSTTAINTPVVTGSYKPLFEAGYIGHIEERKRELIAEIDLLIERVEKEKYPIYLRERENAENRRKLRRSYINQRIFEPDRDFDDRVERLREKNRLNRERYAKIQRAIDSELNLLEQRQEHYREEQKKIEKKCEDIYNLITSVGIVESDPFWRSEIVQIELQRGERDDMRLRMAVRSGNFIVTLGSMSCEEGSKSSINEKLSRLRDFYDEALPRVGWDRYREINIEYKNQVICKR